MLRGFLTTALAGRTGNLLYSLVNPNAYGTSAGDNFGRDVAIDGNYAIVGASYEDDAGGLGGDLTNSGKAYIFNVTTGTLVHTLDNPNPFSTSDSDYFGEAVAISGNYAIVGAYLEDDAGGTSSGKAYIFNVTTGTLVHTLDNPNPFSTSDSDAFGEAVAISGNYAIVGAPYEDDAGGFNSGKAYIFNVTTGTLVHTLNNPNAYGTSDSNFFGYTVAIDGNYAIVGAYLEDDAGGTSSGKAYIFNVTTGTLVHTLNNPNAYDTSANDAFGEAVAISGNYAIVGAPNEDDAGGTSSGKVYIFNVTTGQLIKTLDNPVTVANNAYFGNTVSISQNKAIVGAPTLSNFGPKLLGLNGVYSASALIAQQNVATTDASSFKVTTSGASSATIESIPYIAPISVGLPRVVGPNADDDDSAWNVTPPWGSITYLGTVYNSVWWGSNGYLTFGEGSTEYNLGPTIPALPKIFIFGFDNFIDDLWQGTEGLSPNRVHRVVVITQFDAYNATSFGDGSVVHEIRFYENEPTRIDVHQQNVPLGPVFGAGGGAFVYAL